MKFHLELLGALRWIIAPNPRQRISERVGISLAMFAYDQALLPTQLLGKLLVAWEDLDVTFRSGKEVVRAGSLLSG
jgi:hypothetical protein